MQPSQPSVVTFTGAQSAPVMPEPAEAARRDAALPGRDTTAETSAEPTAETALTDALASLYDAGAVHVPPWQGLVAGLASLHPESVGAAIDWLVAHRAELEAAYTCGRGARLGLAHLPDEMKYRPELGALDRARNDHALRERYLFADIVGKRTFFQTAFYAMTGVELSARDADLLEQIGNTNLQADRRAWPLTVTRRVAARGAGYAAAMTAGTAMMGAEVLAGAAAADCARFLRATRAQVAQGESVPELVARLLGSGRRVMGFGRPLVGPDERVPVMRRLLHSHGRAHLPYVSLLQEVESAFVAQKGLHTTSAAWAAALLLDFGLSPTALEAVCNFWVSVVVHSQAVYATERGLSGTGD